jgi:hypothetical protein
MPAERVSMRRIREILRLKHHQGLRPQVRCALGSAAAALARG